METYVAALNYAIPFFLILIFLEILAARLMHQEVIRSMDTLASLSSGLTNVIKDVLGLTLIIVSYGWMVERIAVVEIQSSWLVYLIAFVGLDFSGYWVHRISHKVNYFWNDHIVHHSSEEFNLGCALRQTISAWFSYSFIFLIPTAMLGVPASVIAIVAPLHLFAQYWYHTRLIGKLGFLEKVIVTPSHHRVHHAINDIYLDKNLGQIFIFWDKWFGTFQEELDDVPPVYGVKRPVRTWNPFIINFMHLWHIIKDAWRAKNFKDKLRIWFMPTGWRPDDVAEAYPIDTIKDVYRYEKYDPKLSRSVQLWSWFQFVVTFGLMMFFFNTLTDLTFSQMLYYGGFLFLTIFSFTMLMDKSPYAWMVEGIKGAWGISTILVTGDWFGINSYLPFGSQLVMVYLAASVLVVTYLNKTQMAEDEKLTSVKI